MSVQIIQTVDNGDATMTVYAVTPTGQYIHIVAGLDRIANGDIYLMLDLAGGSADRKAASIAAHDAAPR